jgi:hypothetical protein
MQVPLLKGLFDNRLLHIAGNSSSNSSILQPDNMCSCSDLVFLCALL